MSIFLISEVKVLKTKQDYINLALQYHEAKKKDKTLTIKAYCDLHDLKYETVSRAFRKFKPEILEAIKLNKKVLSKDQWVKIGIDFKSSGKTAKEYATEKDLNYETFSRAMRKFKTDIERAIELDTIRKKKGVKTKQEQTLILINDFRASLRKIKGLGKTRAERRSQEWFNDVIKTSIKTHRASKLSIGRLYTWAYDAKHKDTLPYWDMFPLGIYLGDSTAGNGNKLLHFLNLHYVPPAARQSFLEELLKRYASTKTYSNKTRLKIDWSKVKGMKGTDLMIKSYLPSHFKTATLEIAPKDWPVSCFMPTQRFVSQGKSYSAKKVWSKY